MITTKRVCLCSLFILMMHPIAAETSANGPSIAFARAHHLAHGINASNWYAQAGDYSAQRLTTYITPQDFALVRRMGFDNVRLSIDAAQLIRNPGTGEKSCSCLLCFVKNNSVPSADSVRAKLQFLVILCVAATSVRGGVVRLEDEKLTFTLPSGWIAIPEQTMAQKNAELQRNLSKPYSVKFKYGYQIQGADWLSFPYLLVKPEADTRIPESKLRELPTIDLSRAEKEVRELLPNFFANISLGRLAYDPNTQKIWGELTSKLAGGEEVRALAMTVLTEKGVTGFYFYAPAEQ